jgi:parallel beta-helix repeat protein
LKDGICFYGGSSNKISENSITGSTEAGIYFAGSNNIVSANDITENKWASTLRPISLLQTTTKSTLTTS